MLVPVYVSSVRSFSLLCTVSYCPRKLRARRLSSEGGAREEDIDPRIPTAMVGHLINAMKLESEE